LNPCTFSKTGALPQGVTFTTGGVLSGIPAAGTIGSYPITITASDGLGGTATQAFTLIVGQAPVVTSPATTTFTVGQSGSFTFTPSGSPSSAFTFNSVLPAGLTFDPLTNTLSGTPLTGTGSTKAYTLTASNGVLPNATQSFTLVINEAPAITSAATKTFIV